MTKTLVVMRHGKAQPLAEDQLDEDRRLTEAGVLALEARLPHMLGLLEANGSVAHIWTSPAVRARQTAELLAQALRARHVPLAKKLEVHESLWEQDLETFLDELRASDDELVFAVGHIPFAEDVVEELVGATPPFSTGALACLDVQLAAMPADAPDHARLLWFAQGPTAAHWNTIVRLQATITQIAERIEDRRAAFFASPEDIETIHRFRTNIRTLRSLLAFIKPWQNAQQNAEAQDILREIVRYTSLLRELDVLEKRVRAKEELSPKTCAFCAREAARERAKVLKTLKSKRVTKMFERAMALAKDITWKKRFAKRGLPPEVVRAHFDALIESVTADLAALDLSDAERTHDVRKRAKRARYVAEFNEDILGADSVEIASGMMAHQDHLGNVCDARANIRLIGESLERDLPKAITRDLTALRQENEVFLNDALQAAAGA